MMRSIPQRWCCQSFQVNELLTVCRKKGPLACHAERERSIWSHQAGGVAHLGFFAALRMTCPGHFFMACRKNVAPTCHAERSEESLVSKRAAWPTLALALAPFMHCQLLSSRLCGLVRRTCIPDCPCSHSHRGAIHHVDCAPDFSGSDFICRRWGRA